MELLTHRQRLRPVEWQDVPGLTALKTDPRAFAIMLGGVRTPVQVQAELAEDQALWARRGVGMWTVRGRETGLFMGIAGIMERPDGRGLSLRFAIVPRWQGKGLAREAAGAALRDALDRGGLTRVIAVTRENNYGSRTVLGGIGMRQTGGFMRDGHQMLLYEAGRVVGD